MKHRYWTTTIPTLLPPVTLDFRQFWLGLVCVGIASVGIAVCTPGHWDTPECERRAGRLPSICDLGGLAFLC
jgi:hypothetical protein